MNHNYFYLKQIALKVKRVIEIGLSPYLRCLIFPDVNFPGLLFKPSAQVLLKVIVFGL